MVLGHQILCLGVGLAALSWLAQAAEAACYCPRPEGLPQRDYGVDFRTPSSAGLTDYWRTSSGSNITHDDRGAGLQYVNRHDAPQLETDFYIWYGRVDFDLQAAPGRGVITSAALKPDHGEGVHWGWSGNDFGQDEGIVQTDVRNGGVTGGTDPRIWGVVDNPQGSVHTYSIDWTPERIDWLIDGHLVNTRLAADAEKDGDPFPQAPSRVQFGVWAGGDPSNGRDVVDWAGGQTDTQGGPYTACLRNVSVTNYNPAGNYEYAKNAEGMKSVRPTNNTARAGSGGIQSLGANNPSRQPLLVGLPKSDRGACGADTGEAAILKRRPRGCSRHAHHDQWCQYGWRGSGRRGSLGDPHEHQRSSPLVAFFAIGNGDTLRYSPTENFRRSEDQGQHPPWPPEDIEDKRQHVFSPSKDFRPLEDKKRCILSSYKGSWLGDNRIRCRRHPHGRSVDWTRDHPQPHRVYHLNKSRGNVRPD
ncbi:hypothetical protein RB594_008902 [Gaeumannomyces avenae]